MKTKSILKEANKIINNAVKSKRNSFFKNGLAEISAPVYTIKLYGEACGAEKVFEGSDPVQLAAQALNWADAHEINLDWGK